MIQRFTCLLGLCLGLTVGVGAGRPKPQDPAEVRRAADTWRAEHRLIDVHQHIDDTPEHLARAVRIMDRVGIGVVVNLSGGTATSPDGRPSEFERNQALADRLYPGRFLHYLNLDYTGWDQADWSARAVKQVEDGQRLGAAGLMEYKRLGLYLRDGASRLNRVDDPKLDPIWRRCGALGLPVSVHVADPQAFWRPYDAANERWKELKDHPGWWFGDPKKYPRFDELLGALDRVIGRHPETTFVCVHFANNAEELDWVDAALDRHPNMMADLAARIPELGRHDPAKVRQLFIKHQDRILFGTDSQVDDRLILGSSGNEPPPTDEDAALFFAKHWRWLETNDRQFEHMTPIQGDWRIDAIGLPVPVLRKIYFDNARRLLVRSLPLPVVNARHIGQDFKLTGRLNRAVWTQVPGVRVEQTLREGRAAPDVTTTVRVLWSDRFLYLGYACPFTDLTVFTPADLKRERVGLWDRDVVEAFIGSDPSNGRHYYEFEVAPNREWLDLELGGATRGLGWNSGFESAVRLDERSKIWTMEMRIPLQALSPTIPQPGTRWRLNLYRHDLAHQVFLAWSPTATSTAHTPERFGYLEFGP